MAVMAAAVELFATFTAPGKFMSAPSARTTAVLGHALLPFGVRRGAFGIVEFAIMVRIESLQHLFADRMMLAFGLRWWCASGRFSLGKSRQGE